MKFLKVVVLLGFAATLSVQSQHLQLTDPYGVAPIFQGALMTTAEREADPQRAVTLTPAALKEMYDFLGVIQEILETHQIQHWATYGTLLGARRHHGIVPWDDDFDFSCFQKDVPKLMGLSDAFAAKGFVLESSATAIRIYKKDGLPLRARDSKVFKLLPGLWYVRHKRERFPFLDIYPVEPKGGGFVHANPIIARDFPTHTYDPGLFFPLLEVPFGPLKVKIPSGSDALLTKMYGPDWAKQVRIFKSHLQS